MTALLVALTLAAAPAEAIDFDTAVARALSSNPAMRLAEQDAAKALAQLEQARAPSLPTLTATATLQQLDHDRVLGTTVLQPAQQAFGNAAVNVPLLAPARWAQWYRAARGAEASTATAADVRRQVAVLAAKSWLSVLAQKRVVEVAESARDAAKGHYEFARERYQGGVGNKLDLLRASQELGTSQSQLSVAQGQLVRLEEALGVVVGAEGPLDVPAQEPVLPAAGDVAAALQGAKESRLDVKAATLRDEVAHAAARSDWADYLPQVNGLFQPFFQSPPTSSTPSSGFVGQLVLTWPLYDGSLRYGQAHERAAAALQASAQLEGLLRQARSEVRAAFEQVRDAEAAAESAKQAARDALEAFQLADTAWRGGVSNNLEVIDAERRSRDAQVQAVLAEDAARQVRLDLLVAAGRFPAP
jgi:outer membrane protein TolC